MSAGGAYWLSKGKVVTITTTEWSMADGNDMGRSRYTGTVEQTSTEGITLVDWRYVHSGAPELAKVQRPTALRRFFPVTGIAYVDEVRGEATE